MSSPLEDGDAAAALDLALRGEDVEGAAALADRLDPVSARSVAWAAALDAAVEFAGGRSRRRQVEGIELAPPTCEPLAHAYEINAREQLARLSVSEAARWIDRHRAALAMAPLGRLAPVRSRLLTAWLAVERDGRAPPGELERLQAEARSEGASATLVEATALLALEQLESLEGSEAPGSPDALALARRAARMARTEELPQPALLANIVLARTRRWRGRPFLATHILVAVKAMAPPAWHEHIEWETVLSSGLGATGAWGIPRDLQALLHATTDATTRRAALERDLLKRWRWSRDAARVGAALGLTAAPAGDDELARWLDGRSEGDVPYGLDGLAGQERTRVWVHGAVASRGARVIARALPRLLAEGTITVADEARRSHRSETALAALALAGPHGLAEEALFAKIYGFAYVRELHAGTLGVCLHRARALLGDGGALERSDGRLVLALRGPVVIADVRASRQIEDRILQRLALTGEFSAKDLAESLGVPLRSVQAALGALVEDGACVLKRDGRTVRYEVEDTTFHEPTAQRRLRRGQD